MLLFSAYSPVGHSIHVCGMVTFVLGDEDVVLPNFEQVHILVTVIFLRVCFIFKELKLNHIPIFCPTCPFLPFKTVKYIV